jgi:hypothetical protein
MDWMQKETDAKLGGSVLLTTSVNTQSAMFVQDKGKW